MTCALVKTIEVKNTLGECIIWDETSQSTWWTDIHEAVLYQYFPDTEKLNKYSLPERLCSFGFIHNDDRLVCAFESGFALYEPACKAITWLSRPEQDVKGTRFNDGRVDRKGRFWSGTMAEGEAYDASGNRVSGSLYYTDGLETRRILGDIEIPNGICWSPDSKKLYFTDSPSQVILAYDFDPVDARLGEKTVFTQITGAATADGSTIDAQGYLWNALWGGSKVVRYTPGGEIDYEIDLPVTQPTCVCFGGPDLNILFVSTARENLTADVLAQQPQAGDVFIFETHFQGLGESRFLLRQ